MDQPPARQSLSQRLEAMLPPAGHQRLLVTISLIASVGLGLYASGSAVYFVRSVGLSPVQFGIGLSVAGLAALPLGVPLGHLADRLGTREVTVGLTALQAALLVAATTVRSFWMFMAVITALGVAQSGANISRSAMITAIVGKEGRVRLSAYNRSVSNAGFALGVLGAGVAIGIDTEPAYLSLLYGNAVITVVALLMYLRLPHVPGTRRGQDAAPATLALRDLPYLFVAQVSGVTRLCETLLTVGLPLWVVTQTSAPRQLAAWLLAINTLLVVLFQVRATRGADTVAGAARIQAWSFIALALTCVAMGVTGQLVTWAAVVVLIIATVLLTAGEMWGEGARWALRYELAPANAQGQYGGVFNLGTAVPGVVGPTMVTALTDRYQLYGWLALGAVFLVGLALSRPAIAWAARTRLPETAAVAQAR